MDFPVWLNAVWLIAMLGTLIFGFCLKGIETHLSKDSKRYRDKAHEYISQYHSPVSENEDWKCEVFTTRLFEERLVDAGIMPFHEMTRCEDGNCKVCFPPRFERKACLCAACLENREQRRQQRLEQQRSNMLTASERRRAPLPGDFVYDSKLDARVETLYRPRPLLSNPSAPPTKRA